MGEEQRRQREELEEMKRCGMRTGDTEAWLYRVLGN